MKYTPNEFRKRKDCELCSDEFRLELLTNIDMLLMFEKGIRGEITQAVRRYAKANNKYINDLCNPNEVSIFLQYVDINSNYRWAMDQDLPTNVLVSF